MNPEVEIDFNIRAFPDGSQEVRARVSIGPNSLDWVCSGEDQAIAFLGETYFHLLQSGIAKGFRDMSDLLYDLGQKKPLTRKQSECKIPSPCPKPTNGTVS